MTSIKREHASPAPAEVFDILAIIFVALLLATSFVAYTYYSKLQQVDAKWNAATFTLEERMKFPTGEETVETLYAAESDANEQHKRLSRLVGYYLGEDAVTNPESAVSQLNEVNAEHVMGKTEAKPKDLSTQAQILTLREAIEKIENKISEVVNDTTKGTKALEAERDQLQGALAEEMGKGKVGEARAGALAQERELQTKLDGELNTLKGARAEYDATKARNLEERKAAEESVERARQQTEKVQKELFDAQQEYKAKTDELKETLKNVKDGVRSLEDIVRKIVNNERDKDQTRPDGEVLSSSTQQQIAWINLKRTDRMLKGMRLEVFRYLKGGKEVNRGLVQVIQVGAEMTRVRILERVFNGKTYKMSEINLAPDHVVREFEIDPLGQGDLVRNRFFDKQIKRVFVFAGKMTGPPDAKVVYKSEELTKLIQEMGDEVHRVVDEETDFIVLGEGYVEDANFKKSEELGIPKMSERELMEVLGKY